MKRHQANDRSLRAALLVNATFSAVCALVCLLAADGLAAALFARGFTVLGLGPDVLVFELGILLLAFAGGVALIATRPMISRGWVRAVIVADVLWALDSAVLLALLPEFLTPLGIKIVIGVAALVALIAVEQAVGLAMLYQGASAITVSRDGGHMTLTASLIARTSMERAWQVMSDQEAYADVADNIGKVEIVEGRGAGMVRQCSDNDGKSWRETCTLWDEGRAFAFRVHTEAADYPYPVAELSGTWSLARQVEGTRIKMEFDIQAKPGLINRMLFHMMSAPFARICNRLLGRWVTIMEGQAEMTAARTAAADPIGQSA